MDAGVTGEETKVFILEWFVTVCANASMRGVRIRGWTTLPPTMHTLASQDLL